MDPQLKVEQSQPQILEGSTTTVTTTTTATAYQRLDGPFIESGFPPMTSPTALSVSVQAEPPPPKYLFPDIVDLGPPAPNTLNFGILLPLNLSIQSEYYWRSVVVGGISAIRLAIDDINASKILPVNISLIMRNSQHPVKTPIGGSNAMLSAAYFVTTNISAVIGDTVSRLSEYSASVTSAVQIPQCSFSSISDNLSSTTLFNYFIRTVPAGESYAIQVLEYVSRMGWRRIGIIYSSDSFGVPFASAIVRRAPAYGIVIILWASTYTPDNDSQDFKQTLGALRSLGSYINLLLCTDMDTLRGLEMIHNEGMAGHPYVWISFLDFSHEIRNYFSEPNRPPASAFNGLIMWDLAYNFVDNLVYNKFLTRWQSLDPALYPNAGPGSTINHAESRAYSCAWMLALGYRRDIEKARRQGASESQILHDLVTGQFPRTFGNLSVELFDKITYDGPDGKVELNKDGNRIGGTWMFYQLQNDKPVAVAKSSLSIDDVQNITVFPGKHVWPRSRYNQTPQDSPEWVRQNLYWSEPLAIVLVSIAGLIALVCLVMIGIVWRKRHHPVIKASSPCFCILELVGILLLCASIPMRIGTTTNPICYTMALSFMGGINLILSAIVVKNYRVYRIFSNVYSNKIVMTDAVLLKHAGVLFAATMSATLIYLAVARPRVVYISIDASSTALICLPTNGGDISGSIQMVMAIPTVSLLGFACFLAYKTRGVSANWNEAKAISYVVYNLVFTALMYTVSTLLYKAMYRPSTITQDVVVLYAALVCLIVLFVPKLLVMWQQHRLESSRASSATTEHEYDDDLHHRLGGIGNHIGEMAVTIGSVNSIGRKGSFGMSGRGGGGSGSVGNSATATGIPELLRLRALDPDIAFSNETGTVMTFEQFEDRLNETTSSLPATKATDTRSTTSHRNECSRIRRGSGQRSSTLPPIFQPVNPTILRSLSLEHRTSCYNGGPESYELLDSPDIWNSGDRIDGISNTSGAGNGADFFRKTSRVAPDDVGPALIDDEEVSHSTFHGSYSGSSGQDSYNRSGSGSSPGGSRLSPMTTGESFSSSTDLGRTDFGSGGASNGYTAGNNMDYNKFRMGIFSFGIKDETQTVPVLIIDMRPWRWFIQFTARWRAMQIIVVSSLNMVILSDQGAKSRAETFLYTMAESFTESKPGGNCCHFFLRVKCLNSQFLQLEFPNVVARDQWFRVFNALSPDGRNLLSSCQLQGPGGSGNGNNGGEGPGSTVDGGEGEGEGQGSLPITTTLDSPPGMVAPTAALVEGSKRHHHHHHHIKSMGPLKWVQRHSTIFESGPEVQEEELESIVPDRFGNGLGTGDLK
ncbi:hypothetical protein BGZ96_010544 [Linnemannia gamsii]|uniref:G-protein coupled receptors family 3 profile domain-containing protein n=1 Tax=Linnemannia gamsii TaxID=64522 RepID=A0ABQ7JUS1_9FUNG|nr:hypothetical protein BGZ96_010544 [Linnemannia gamsii]